MSKTWVLAAFIFVTATVHGDSYTLTPGTTVENYAFGPVKIVQTIKILPGAYHPTYTTEVLRDGERQALYKGVGFEWLYSDKNNDVFVGLSNTGITRVAAVVFYADGTIETLVRHHRFKPTLCKASVTIDRQWVHPIDPDVRFDYFESKNEKRVIGVSVRDCYGARTNLYDLIAEGHSQYLFQKEERRERNEKRALHGLRKRHQNEEIRVHGRDF